MSQNDDKVVKEISNLMDELEQVKKTSLMTLTSFTIVVFLIIATFLWKGYSHFTNSYDSKDVH